VIQYDVPRSLTAYVHRVGRTARAGRGGEAWTLYGHSEARWFFREIGGDVKGVKRAGLVEKVKIEMSDDDMRERLKDVVEEVRRRVFEGR
jgi:ATP-dependent RNA helicase DDX51/DBP6